ncbi:MAG: helix-turn-helix domain-containing protein [Candidatus Brocadiia bacterium]
MIFKSGQCSVEAEERGGELIITLRVPLPEGHDASGGAVLLDLEEAADLLNRSKRTVGRYLTEGLLHKVVDDGRRHPSGHLKPLVFKSEVEHLLGDRRSA